VKLCVAIPALNEERSIETVIEAVPRSIEGVTSLQIVVVDDGSSDATRRLASAAGAHVISHGENRGVGAAFHSALEYALAMGADILVNIDGDGQFDPADIARLVAPVVADEADFVTASRFADPALYPDMPRVKFLGNKMMSWLISFLTGKDFRDVSCGFRAYSRLALLHLNLFGTFTYTQETFLDLSFKRLRIRELPMAVRGTRQFGKSRVASSISRYAARTALIIFRSFRDYRPMIVFGSLAALMATLATALGLFLLVHYARTGQFSPHKWAGFSAGFLFTTAMVTFVTGLIADMLARIRSNQERMLLMLKRKRPD